MSNDLLVVSRKGNYRKEYPPSVPDTVRKEKPLMNASMILMEMLQSLDTDSIAWEIIAEACLKLQRALIS